MWITKTPPKEYGFYWIKRSEPDGDTGWEPASLTKHGWYVLGNSNHPYVPENPNASNAWRFGPRIEVPTILHEVAFAG